VDLTGARWRKSSRSNGSSGQEGCVEVAFLVGAVALRDSKDRSLPPHRYPAEEWRAFLAGVRAGEFDQP
jgi:hypothetical protein